MINPDERLTILANKNVSRGKMAAAAVHAALMHYGIPHGAVIVLGASPGRIEDECSLIIRDAGRTEVEPGTVTAGVREGEVDTQRHALLDAATELAHKLRNPYRPETARQECRDRSVLVDINAEADRAIVAGLATFDGHDLLAADADPHAYGRPTADLIGWTPEHGRELTS